MSMTLIQTVTVGAGGAASIEFTGIPQDGTDLLVLVSGRNTSTGNTVAVRFNGNSGANYDRRRLGGTGSITYSDSGAGATSGVFGNIAPNTATANTFGNFSAYMPNYTSSVAKSWSYDSVSENNATAAPQEISAGLWNQTAAITAISILVLGANLDQHSTASLYKITKF